ncbi:DUF502 domain-containing protein [Flavobacterium johnsoniae]|jgi:uncharacterized membrane protein|uniref:Uncharacterized membrane protein n=2 Tax=Flavobacterium johnsoniae TaxID=986 RepID=A0A1M6QNR9_FLAJO|nr:DUF502 domain-containing protein [Flavobacterium johnsoniae]ABQ04418.1 conserved hypothetical protein [Flavobacterium johnsoniae UW101]OXE97742.1 hypothetical protein B0A63_16555 [Flavobacterium johnsoniae UW101]WQG83788.1 DUF502 domain-containing protein [Flavobacterium johnsoniae UW101]SHG07019.1 Uncharacterized membrane protein [Flavobacterium johnsoniae]SHK21939.1 Uncharacterized membrane protein [Flavobacterium johnsoniae]
MKSIFKIIKATFLGGILFLVPLVVLLIILEKGYGIIQKITLPLVNNLPRVHVLGIALQELIGILIIILICFAAGLLARTARAKKLIQKLEDGILSFVPGYSFMKSMNESIMGFESKQDLKVILVPTDAGWQFAFLIEQINENNFTVFIPDAPNPWSGSVVLVEKKDIREIEITQKEALACIRKLGYGSKELLKNKF